MTSPVIAPLNFSTNRFARVVLVLSAAKPGVMLITQAALRLSCKRSRTFRSTHSLAAYYGTNLDRLKQIKRKSDPDNFFQFEQSIPLAPLQNP